MNCGLRIATTLQQSHEVNDSFATVKVVQMTKASREYESAIRIPQSAFDNPGEAALAYATNDPNCLPHNKAFKLNACLKAARQFIQTRIEATDDK